MKRSLRQLIRARRDALPPGERMRAAQLVGERLLLLAPVREAHVVAAYRALPSELDLGPTLVRLHSLGKRLALPRVVPEGLAFHAWTPGDPLVGGPHGLEEPSADAPVLPPGALDVVLVPGVAFDRRGHRLGFGRGFYDRLLGRVPRERRIGVAFDLQIVDRLPAEPHDVPMGWIVTPAATIRGDH